MSLVNVHTEFWNKMIGNHIERNKTEDLSFQDQPEIQI